MNEMNGPSNCVIIIWDMVEPYCIAFEPLQYITEKIQFHSLQYDNFSADWHICKICTEKINNSQHLNPHVRVITATLLQKTDTRTLEMLKKTIFAVCLFFDPRFKTWNACKN